MDDQKGKEISLIHTTVKIPGMMKPRGATKMGMSTNGLLKTQLNDLSSREGRKNGIALFSHFMIVIINVIFDFLEEIKLIFCWEKVAIFWSVCGP
jgi:hypothetical protein